jgi:hypothetical protein
LASGGRCITKLVKVYVQQVFVFIQKSSGVSPEQFLAFPGKAVALGSGEPIWSAEMYSTTAVGPLTMCNLKEAEDEAVAPMPCMFT